jgi:dihydrofolate reductase
MGSTTYEWLLRTEGLLEVPQKWQRFFGDLHTCVLTSRVLPTPEGADVTFLTGPVSEHISRIVALAGERNVWVVGGGDIAAQFLDCGRLDRLEVTFAPVALTGGAPVLPRFVSAGRLSLEAVHKEGPFARLSYRVVSPGIPPSIG